MQRGGDDVQLLPHRPVAAREPDRDLPQALQLRAGTVGNRLAQQPGHVQAFRWGAQAGHVSRVGLVAERGADPAGSDDPTGDRCAVQEPGHGQVGPGLDQALPVPDRAQLRDEVPAAGAQTRGVVRVLDAGA